MSPSQFHIKKEINLNEMYPSRLLKIDRDSHFIKKSSSSSCASSSASSASVLSVSALTSTTNPPPRPPVIIYTHAPKVIRTNPNDFMTLVQKLTGLSKADGNPNYSPKKEPKDETHGPEDPNSLIKNIPKVAHGDESESSVVTEDSGPSTVLDDVHINSTPIFDLNVCPCFDNIPMFTPNNYLCSNHLPFYDNYVDPLLFMRNMRSSTSSSTNMETTAKSFEF